MCLRDSISYESAEFIYYPVDIKTKVPYYPAGEAGIGIKGGVGGGSVSSTYSPIGSHMAGPITVKLSGIDRGNSVSVLVRARGGIIQDL